MIWFPSIRIINYESHKDTFIQFSPGLNLIIGETDAGKSSIQRAIRWACYNEPNGDLFIRRDADYILAEANGENPKVVCEVTIEISNGFTVTRSKGLGVNLNRYLLVNPEGEELEFNNFGLEIPEEIRKALGFHHLSLDKSKLEVNYIPQMESPLAWAYQGAGLSRLLNKFNNIDDFENLLKRINKKIHARGEIPTEIKVLQSNIEEKTKELATLTDPTEAIKLAEDLLEDATIIDKKEQEIIEAKRILRKCADIKQRQEEIEFQITASEKILDLREPVGDLVKMANKIKTAVALIYNAEILIDRLKILDKKLSIATILSEIDLASITILYDKLVKAYALIKKAQEIGDKIKNSDQKIENIESLLHDLSEKLDYQLSVINVCPTCEQDLKGDSIDKVIRKMTHD